MWGGVYGGDLNGWCSGPLPTITTTTSTPASPLPVHLHHQYHHHQYTCTATTSTHATSPPVHLHHHHQYTCIITTTSTPAPPPLLQPVQSWHTRQVSRHLSGPGSLLRPQHTCYTPAHLSGGYSCAASRQHEATTNTK